MTGVTKACSACGTDLDGKKRVKDPTGTYFCPDCWAARTAVTAGRGPPPLPRSATPPPAARSTPRSPAAPPSSNVLGKKLGFLAVGVGTVALFDLWPLYQVGQHADHVTLSFKGIIFGWWVVCIALIAMLPERVGIAWTRPEGQPATGAVRIKAYVGLSMVVALALTAATYVYVQRQGYTIKF